MNKLVSAIIPTYNRANTICRAIDSILNQSYKNIEIIIIDDGSTDDTLKLLKKYGSRIRVVNQCHKGANAARNRGIKEAKGEYIAFLDSDDEWLPQKTNIQLSYLDKNGKQVCFCPYQLIDDTIQVIPGDYYNIDKYENGINIMLSQGNVIGTPILIMNKAIFDNVGLFNESMQRFQDYELCIRIAKKYKIGYVPQILVNAYRLQRSISSNQELGLISYGQIMKMHCDFINKDKLVLGIIESYEKYRSVKIKGEMIDYISEKTGIPKSDILDTVLNMYQQTNSQKTDYINALNEHDFEVFMKKNQGKEFAIFGTGKIADKVYQKLFEEDKIPSVFYVSKKLANQDVFHDIVIETINGKDIHKPIIIAVGYHLQIEVMEFLDSMEFDNYCVYPIGRLEQ